MMSITFKKYIIPALVAAFLLLQSCKSNKVLAEGEIKGNLSVKSIIKNHYKNQLDFKTIRGRMKVEYKNGKDSQSVTLSLRMEKDKAIWLSAPLSVVKVLITPEKVSFYNNLDGTYFDGDFSYISNLLRTELNFEKVQNLLLGQAIFNLKDDSYFASVVENNYQLKPENDILLFKKLFLLEPLNFKMALQQLSQPNEGRILNINYKTYQNVKGKVFPNELLILAEEGDNKTQIDITYRNIEFNQKVNFPFAIPKGFKEISIK